MNSKSCVNCRLNKRLHTARKESSMYEIKYVQVFRIYNMSNVVIKFIARIVYTHDHSDEMGFGYVVTFYYYATSKKPFFLQRTLNTSGSKPTSFYSNKKVEDLRFDQLYRPFSILSDGVFYCPIKASDYEILRKKCAADRNLQIRNSRSSYSIYSASHLLGKNSCKNGFCEAKQLSGQLVPPCASLL